MPKLRGVSFGELVRKLKTLNFEGPFSGGKHLFMVRGHLRLTIPNPHRQDIGADLLTRILRQGEIETPDCDPRKVEMTDTDNKQVAEMISAFTIDIKREFQHQLTVQREDFQKQIAFVGEGFQMLSEKMDRVEKRVDERIDCVVKKLDAVAAQGAATAARLETVAAKLDAVAADLKAHRADTEAHRPVYRVKE